MIAWAAACLWAVLAIGLFKIAYMMELNKNSVTRNQAARTGTGPPGPPTPREVNRSEGCRQVAFPGTGHSLLQQVYHVGSLLRLPRSGD